MSDLNPSGAAKDEECGEAYLVPDSWEAFEVSCTLPLGHDGPHTDCTGAFTWELF